LDKLTNGQAMGGATNLELGQGKGGRARAQGGNEFLCAGQMLTVFSCMHQKM